MSTTQELRARRVGQRTVRWCLFTALAASLPSMAHAADEATAAKDRNDGAIAWHLPHDFDAAVARAKKQKRILVIKGVSFGIDDAGAKCATKGKW